MCIILMGTEMLGELDSTSRTQASSGSRIKYELMEEIAKIQEEVAKEVRESFNISASYDYLVKKIFPITQKEGDVDLEKRISEMWMEVEIRNDEIKINQKDKIYLSVYCGSEKGDIKRIETTSIGEITRRMESFKMKLYLVSETIPAIDLWKKLFFFYEIEFEEINLEEIHYLVTKSHYEYSIKYELIKSQGCHHGFYQVLRLFGDLSDKEKIEIKEKDRERKDMDKLRRDNLSKYGALRRKIKYGRL
ncbi:MAG: hypothetical protein PF549_02640 [Patescibacteria group bacterium]|jgi:hypothetical protein|nr:hypothetical protein [Patescibacteria group bacterium]